MTDKMCQMINDSIKDEASAVLFYAKIIGEMPSEHKEHIKIIEEILEDEADHFFKFKKIAEDMKCPEIEIGHTDEEKKKRKEDIVSVIEKAEAIVKELDK
jgi:rubrerythrin